MRPCLILASASPRRRELLAAAGFSDLIVRPARGEEILPSGCSPAETVMALALQKAREVARRSPEPDAVILAADTVVVLDGDILGKPRDPAEAAAMLGRLSGRSHEVFTGVALLQGARCLTRFARTEVFFRELAPEEITAYVATGEPMDKAGAYGIQGRAGLFAERLEGDYCNVVGLPLYLTGQMLKELDVELL